MVDSIATTSLIGYRPVVRGSFSKDTSYKRRTNNFCRVLLTDFVGCRSICTSTSLNRPRTKKWGIDQYGSSIKALAMELTKEASAFREDNRTPKNMNFPVDTDTHRQTGYWPPPNKADNPSIHNPLLRQERLGCGWLGAIFEWEGVIIEDNPELESQAWLTLAQEEGKSSPPAFILKRIEGMKTEHALSEVLCWSRDPTQLRRMATKKEEIYQRLQGGIYSLRTGSREFLDFLMNYKIPMALVSTRPRKTLEAAVRVVEMEGSFNVIVAAEDVYRGKPDPEMFVYAAQLLKFIPERCIVFGNSNSTVEAAHDARMKCVAVASKHPVYELGAADLVVRHLDELTVVDLKNLAATELPEFGSDEPEFEMEEERDEPHRSTSVGVDDSFWFQMRPHTDPSSKGEHLQAKNSGKKSNSHIFREP